MFSKSESKRIVGAMVSAVLLSAMFTGCKKDESDGNFYTNAFTTERLIEFSIDPSKQELTILKDDTNQLNSTSDELQAACRYSIRAGTYKYTTDGQRITGIIGFDPSEKEPDTLRQFDFPTDSPVKIILSASEKQRYLLSITLFANKLLIIGCESEVWADY